MLAEKIKEPVDNEAYVHEVKWDGFRIIAYKQGPSVMLRSRGNLDYTSIFTPVTQAVQSIKSDVVLDGEVCVLDDDGLPDFEAVQNYQKEKGDLVYYVFDLLWLDGRSWMQEPYEKRKKQLRKIISGHTVLLYSDHFEDGKGLFELAKEKGLEGIVSKRKDSPYKPGIRGGDWLKTPIKQRQEFVLGAWVESQKARSFRSLLFGAYTKQGALEWVGRSGSGFKEEQMKRILQKLQALEVKKSPFINEIKRTKGFKIHYIQPQLVAEFEFSGFTREGYIRKPATFLGFRKDKDPRQVFREKTVAVDTIAETASETRQKKPRYLNKDSGWRAVDQEQQGAQWTDFKVEGCTVPVHNLDRELWKGTSKGKLLLYYSEMADYLLPYCKDRPQSLALKLSTVYEGRTFIKDMEHREPSCSTVFTDRRRKQVEGKRNKIDYLICNNTATLLYMVNLGCVDINPWASRYTAPDHPDYITIDLDPTVPDGLSGKRLLKAEEDGFQKAIEIAQAAKSVFDQYKITSLIKTSGQTGLHLYLPCAGLRFQQAKRVAQYLAEQIHRRVATISTLEISKDLRGTRVFLDTTLNAYAFTIAAPYSVRPYHHEPLVSTPLRWQEVSEKSNRFDFTMESIFERVKQKGDLFKDLLDSSVAKKNSKIFGQWV
jgi:bifunctional non-homologous end joining protein LigD